MSRLVLILLIALLPLRGWSVDRMYVGMAINKSASHSMDTGASQGSMPEDCPMMSGIHSDKGASHGKGKTEVGIKLASFVCPWLRPKAQPLTLPPHYPRSTSFLVSNALPVLSFCALPSPPFTDPTAKPRPHFISERENS